MLSYLCLKIYSFRPFKSIKPNEVILVRDTAKERCTNYITLWNSDNEIVSIVHVKEFDKYFVSYQSEKLRA